LSVNTNQIYEVIADFPITINLLFRNVSEQASILAASKTSTNVFQPLHLFRLFATSNLLGCISETTTLLCVGMVLLPLVQQHFMMQISPQNIMRLTSLKPNCQFSFAEGGGSNTFVSLQMA